MITQIKSSLYDQCLAEFGERQLIEQAGEPAGLARLRKQAIEQFEKLGFPSVKSEEWKYTNLAPFLREEYRINITEPQPVQSSDVKDAFIPSLDAYHLVTVNGVFRPDLSDSISSANFRLLPIREAVNENGFDRHFGKHLAITGQPFAALNTALFRDGLYLEVAAGTIVKKPIHLIHIRATGQNRLLQPRNLFVVDKNADATILESYITLDNSENVLVNEVSEIVLAENARLHHYLIQQGREGTRQIQFTQVFQEASSVYNNYKFSLPGADLLRNNLYVALDGKNIESHLYGVYLTSGRQVADNHTLVDHRKAHCQSNELYKGVIGGSSTAVFNGKIFVQQDAQKTNAFQQNNNLLLSDTAVVDSKPQLEIFADDVKCSHGSTVGRFNEQAIFYLRSRGIGEEKARALLIQAFLFDVTDKIPVTAIQEYVNHLIEAGLETC